MDSVPPVVELRNVSKIYGRGDAEVRAISGSVFGGRRGDGPCAYLGRFANQVSLL